MTQTEFDQLVLEVARGIGFTAAEVAYPYEVKPVASSKQLQEFANRLRKEWVKSLEPVAWAATEFGEVKDLSLCDDNGYTLPLYTLSELEK